MMAGHFTHIGSRIYNYDSLTFIIPLYLLFYSNVETIIASVEKGDELLENLNRGTFLTKEVINETFTAIEATCMAHSENSLDQDDLIKLAAYSFAGQIADLEDSPVAGKTCSVLQDEFLCLTYHHYDDRKAIIPDTILHQLANIDSYDTKDDASFYFVRRVKEFIEKTDDKKIEIEPWNMWKYFGAD
jgi:hypothetical protein